MTTPGDAAVTTTALPERFNLASEVPRDDRLVAVRAAFPEAVRESKIDFDVLRRSLGDWVEPGPERFGLSWPGKAECTRVIQEPSIGTLVPMPDDSVDWDTTENVVIEGDNLEALKLLQKAYYGKVNLIYIDPPYNTGKEFIYPDNFREGLADYLRYSGQTDEEGIKLTANAETDGRYHSKWLSMMYPRLFLARNLLREDGLIFVSIDDHEVHNLRALMNEIFGEENFLGMITRSTGTPTGGGFEGVVNLVDYMIVYGRTTGTALAGVEFTADDESIYNQEDEKGNYLTRSLRRTGGEDRREDRPSMYYGIPGPDGVEVFPIGPGGYESRWICGYEKYLELERDGLIEWKQPDGVEGGWKPYQKFYLEGRTKQPSNLWLDVEGNKKGTRELRTLFNGEKVFDSPKPVDLLRRVIDIGCSEDGLILDFFAGSGTTGQAAMEANAKDGGRRRYILVQLPEPTDRADLPTIAALMRQRLRAAGSEIAKAPSLTGATDTGFRSYRLEPSNFSVWSSAPAQPEAIAQQLALAATSHVSTTATEASMLVELLLKAGYLLTAPVEQVDFARVAGYSIGEGALFVCLTSQLTIEAFEAMAERDPAMILVLDSGFGGSDELKVNALQTVRARKQWSGTDIALRVV
jgi:adenine-specific DNA-methyltransferase